MPLPRKFKELLESTAAETPDFVWMVYAVCGAERESCGWHGWALEGAGKLNRIVESDDYLRCPKCGRALFRTDDGVKFDRSPEQPVHRKPGIDYEVAEPTYIDDDDPRWEAEDKARREAEDNARRKWGW